MGRVIMNEPPPGDWCVACLMLAKQEQWVMFQDEIQAGYEASGEKLKVIEFPAALAKEMNPGRWRAVCGEFPMLGVVDGLCWQHVAGGQAPQPVQPQAPVLDTTTKLPPGLVKRRPK